MKYLFWIFCVCLLSGSLPAQITGNFPPVPLGKGASSSVLRQIEDRVSDALQAKTASGDYFAQAQRQLDQLKATAPTKFISWKEYLKLNERAKERTIVSYNLDLEGIKRSMPQKDDIAELSFNNSFPDYKQLLKGFQYIYVGEEHDTVAAPAEMIRIMQAVRSLYPNKRILLASEFLSRLEDDISPLTKKVYSKDFLSSYPNVSRAAEDLGIDQLALDDYIADYREENSNYFLASKCGQYFVMQKHKIPESEIGREEFSDAFWEDWQNFAFLVAYSPFGILERNRQWARYINAVKPFYDVILVYAGRGHTNATEMNDVQAFVGSHDFASILLFPTEENNGSYSNSLTQELNRAEASGILCDGKEAELAEKKGEAARCRVTLKGEWADKNKPFWGIETVEEPPLTDLKSDKLFTHRYISIILPEKTVQPVVTPVKKPQPKRPEPQPEPVARKGNLYI